MNEISTGRTVPEITADIRLNLRNAVGCIAAIGRDLIEAKQMLQHGEWTPWLKSMGMSPDTAQNYMRYAREIPAGSWLESLPYSKAMEILKLPAGDREEFAEANHVNDKSIGEIKRLVAEAKKANEEAAAARIREEAAQKAADELREKLKNQKPEIVREEVEPADYQPLKDEVGRLRRRVTEAEDAAVEAEEKAETAAQEAEQLRIQLSDVKERRIMVGDYELDLSELYNVCSAFLAQVWAVPFMGDRFLEGGAEDRRSYRLAAESVKSWAEQVLNAIDEAGMPIVVSGVA